MQQKMFDGSYQTFEKLKRPDTVVILPVTNNQEIVLVNHYQPGKQPSLRAPAGRIDPGETPETTARRELLEETGYQTDKLKLWYAIQPQSKIDWAIYIFIAKNCQKVSEPVNDPGEKTLVRLVSFNKFLDLSVTHRITGTETTNKILQAKLNPHKMQALKKLFLD